MAGIKAYPYSRKLSREKTFVDRYIGREHFAEWAIPVNKDNPHGRSLWRVNFNWILRVFI